MFCTSLVGNWFWVVSGILARCGSVLEKFEKKQHLGCGTILKKFQIIYFGVAFFKIQRWVCWRPIGGWFHWWLSPGSCAYGWKSPTFCRGAAGAAWVSWGSFVWPKPWLYSCIEWAGLGVHVSFAWGVALSCLAQVPWPNWLKKKICWLHVSPYHSKWLARCFLSTWAHCGPPCCRICPMLWYLPGVGRQPHLLWGGHGWLAYP